MKAGHFTTFVRDAHSEGLVRPVLIGGKEYHEGGVVVPLDDRHTRTVDRPVGPCPVGLSRFPPPFFPSRPSGSTGG